MITDFELIQQFQKGDKSAFDTLVKKHFNTTYGLLLRMVQEPFDAEDLCQEVYIKVYKNLEKFRFESEFSTWLYRISINAANNFFRKRKLREIFGVGKNITQMEAPAEKPFSSHEPILWDAITKLPKNQRTSVMLRNFQQLPFKKIAGVMGITENSAKVNYHYALKNLKKHLKKDYE